MGRRRVLWQDGAGGNGGVFLELTARGVSQVFGGTTALDDIGLHVADGEVLGVIGPSGCGKSTLLSILGGLLRPTRGAVTVRGDKPPGCLVEIAYVFQDFNLLPWRTAEGNVRLPLEHHRLSAAEMRDRVDEALARIGLTEFRHALPRQLSGGMRQRVGIARALAVHPAVLLLDEPLSALDAQTRDLLMEDFARIWARERTTAVYVTHNLPEALHLADRVAIFTRRPGRVREVVSVDVPRAERAAPAGRTRLAALHDHLWGAIREEALVADRELDGREPEGRTLEHA